MVSMWEEEFSSLTEGSKKGPIRRTSQVLRIIVGWEKGGVFLSFLRVLGVHPPLREVGKKLGRKGGFSALSCAKSKSIKRKDSFISNEKGRKKEAPREGGKFSLSAGEGKEALKKSGFSPYRVGKVHYPVGKGENHGKRTFNFFG